ncbi:MAG: PQQ-dependent sugar dehydrogenase [Acidimicrobiia bacterium]|nr:PQQ-dependent sugar dehydrogenase [Acidimicrobiia bacterium]
MAAAAGCTDSGSAATPTTSTAVEPPTTAAPAPETTTSAPATTAPPTSAAPATTVPPGPQQFAVQTVASGLEVPWGLAFLPDGRALVAQRRTGEVLVVDANGGTQVVATLPSVDQGEGGLLGLAVPADADPAAPEVYAYLTAGSENQVVRFTLGQSGVAPVLVGIPAAGNHNGGRIAFGPDGFLYIGTGDASEDGLAQDQGSLAGKILRITRDGQAAPGNPIAGNPLYSFGHRNVQGLAWDAQGRLYATEFGQNSFDEVNLIQPGANYGWPIVEGQGGDSRFVEPIVTWTTSEASPSGAAILSASALPGWDGDLFVAGLRGARLWRVDLAPDGSVAGQEPLLVGEYGRLRTVAQAPDGSLWVTTSNRDGRGDPAADDDRILRLAPA